MESIRFTLESNSEIWNFIDKTAEHVLLHNFRPNNIIKWWTSTVKLSQETILENVEVRNMHFDIRTSISKLKQILDYDSDFLDIYQFDKPVSGTLEIDRLPNNSAETILIQNGLQHIISVDFESITVSSIRPDFIKSIAENSLFADRIHYNSTDKL